MSSLIARSAECLASVRQQVISDRQESPSDLERFWNALAESRAPRAAHRILSTGTHAVFGVAPSVRCVVTEGRRASMARLGELPV
jgi:hypothetical protein